MEAARVLQEALASMSWSVERGTFALVGFAAQPHPEDLACLTRAPSQIIREVDQTTLLVEQGELSAVLARHPDASYETDLHWIRFDTPMSWEVVGFLAAVSSELARAGVPLGAVCGFQRDHLFIAGRHMDTARAVLERMFPRRTSG